MKSIKDQFLVALGENLMSLRKKNGYSQEKLAEITELDRSYIGGIERGERNVTVLTLLKIVNALNCSFSELLEK